MEGATTSAGVLSAEERSGGVGGSTPTAGAPSAGESTPTAGPPSVQGGPGGGEGLTAGRNNTPPFAGAPFTEGGPGALNAGGSTPIARKRDRLSLTKQKQARQTQQSLQNAQPANLVSIF